MIAGSVLPLLPGLLVGLSVPRILPILFNQWKEWTS
jgi:hypothetical protein